MPRLRLSFRQAVAQNMAELRRMSESHAQQVIGMTSDEIFGEMLSVTWEAYQKWDPKKNPKFAAWVYTCWENRRKDLLKGIYRKMRDRRATVFYPRFTDAFAEQHNLSSTADLTDQMFVVPGDFSEDEAQIWLLIGSGADLARIRDAIGRGLYYRLLRSWRTEEIYRLLHGEDDAP
jgi:DNA-directed RNA polymerase specialized sigma24 family protein